MNDILEFLRARGFTSNGSPRWHPNPADCVIVKNGPLVFWISTFRSEITFDFVKKNERSVPLIELLHSNGIVVGQFQIVENHIPVGPDDDAITEASLVEILRRDWTRIEIILRSESTKQ